MSTGIGAQLLLDGVPVQDGSPGENELDPTALSPLQITWGRATTVDQPESSSGTVTILDLAGGAAFIDQFATGKQIQVLASGTIYPDPTDSTFPDPGFETDPVTVTTANAIATVSPRRPHTGNQSVMIVPVDGLTRTLTLIPPAAFSAGDPAAWDAIPVTSAGQTWQYGAWVFLPPGASAQLRPVLFSGPFATSAAVVNAPIPISPGADEYVFVTGSFVPGADRAWVGVQLTVFPTGNRWVDMPPDQSWAETITGGPGVAGEPTAPTITGTNLVTDPNATRPAPSYGSTSVVISAVPIDDHPAGIGTANEVAYRAGAASSGIRFPTGDLPAGTYTISAWVRQTLGDPIQGGFAQTAVAAGPSAPISTEWARVSWTRTSTSTAATFGYRLNPVASVDGIFQITGLQVEAAADMTGYIAGNLPAAGDGDNVVAYAWTGAANASTSTRTATRRSDLPAWLDFSAAYVDDVEVLSPAGGTDRSVLVFEGRITDLAAAWDDGHGGVSLELTTTDFTADLENIRVGDEPWPVESTRTRFDRVLAMSNSGVVGTVDDSIADILVSWQDVDSHGTMSLLKDLAQSVDGVLWSAAHQVTGGYLTLEDPANRASLYRLTLDPDTGLVEIIETGGGPELMDISACDVLRDPVVFEQSVADISTRASVTWLEQTVDDEGKNATAEHTVIVTDPALEVTLGVRNIAVSTLLQSAADASDVADRVLARTHSTAWRAAGITIDDDQSLEVADAAAANMLFTLLDGTARNGLGIRLTDLPTWTPGPSAVPVHLEGGTYTFEGGTWTLALNVSSAVAQGYSASWADLDPAWRWVDFDPAISWLDLIGTAGPITEGT